MAAGAGLEIGAVVEGRIGVGIAGAPAKQTDKQNHRQTKHFTPAAHAHKG